MSGAIDPQTGREITDDELAWFAAHVGDLRRSVVDRRIRYQILWSGLVIGLVAHAAGFLFKSSVTGEPAAVLADLLYTLGWALWTGVVVVALVDIIPNAKERQISRALDTYEAALRARVRRAERTPESPDVPGEQQG